MGGAAPSTPDSSPLARDTPTGAPRRDLGVRVGAVVVLALAAAFVAWLVWGRDSDETKPAAPPATTLPDAALTPSSSAVARPALVTLAELRAQARRSQVPFIWVGSRARTHIELTRTPSGTIFIRYLPPTARAGDVRPFLTVATYPRPNAFAEVQNAAKDRNDRKIELAGGGIAVYDPKQPTNVHIAYPTQPYQVEVYAPAPGAARQLVAAGAVRPIG